MTFRKKIQHLFILFSCFCIFRSCIVRHIQCNLRRFKLDKENSSSWSTRSSQWRGKSS